jgi:radical SAM protein with 4Fe4S-binding SPASM domain
VQRLTTLSAAPRRGIALGVGLTNACNLRCAHCYRGTGSEFLRTEDVLSAALALPTRAVNFGTGESALHPDFASIVRALHRQGIAVTMTTNGFSARALDDADLRLFRDVEFSIDYPTEAEHDRARGAGNWLLIAEQMDRCRTLGVATAIVSVMMSTNHLRLVELLRLAAERDALLRVNVYQAVNSDAFSMSYHEFWSGWAAVLEVAEVVACGEPILRAALGIARAPGAGCGVETVRLSPRGRVVPCVYGADDGLALEDLARIGTRVTQQEQFARLRTVPSPCDSCPAVETCGGGCASRRALGAGIHAPDPYCPVARGETFGVRGIVADADRQLPKASSACTTVLRARG